MFNIEILLFYLLILLVKCTIMNLLKQVFDTINPLPYTIHPTLVKDRDEIVVMQWNILRDRGNETETEFILPKIINEEKFMEWKERCKSIAFNINSHSPDFVTFQEGNDIYDVLNELNGKYGCILSTNKENGVGILYNDKKYVNIEFNEIDEKIVMGKFTSTNGKKIWVGSAHLKSGKNIKHEQTRCEKVKLICQFIENKIFEKDTNWIIGMDCNTDYGYSSENLALNYLDKWLPSVGNITNYPEYTTLKIRSMNSIQEEKKGKYTCAAIDRIMFSSNFNVKNKWKYPTKPKVDIDDLEYKAKNELIQFSDDANLRSQLLPNLYCPSDHLYVLCSLV